MSIKVKAVGLDFGTFGFCSGYAVAPPRRRLRRGATRPLRVSGIAITDLVKAHTHEKLR